jgi:hypothetical protein
VRAVSRCGWLLAVAVMACGAQTVDARADHGAVSINPGETDFVGTTQDPTLNYGSATIRCDTGTVTGATGTDSDIVDLEG